MSRASAYRYCRSCGVRLARDHAGKQCSPCEKRFAHLRLAPPAVGPDFWDNAQFRDAFTAQHIGQVARAYRKHPRHVAIFGKEGIPQEVFGAWLGFSQAQVSRIESGPPVRNLDSLVHWARILRIPESLLWFKLPPERSKPAAAVARTGLESTHGIPVVHSNAFELQEDDDVNRRELLRLLSMAGTTVAVSALADHVDCERLQYSTATRSPLDPVTVDEHGTLNAHLWQVFALSRTKSAALPLVREQLDVLVSSLRQPQLPTVRKRLCELLSDSLQLAGEILFDGNQYTEAAHCYTLAATASREADAYDLWACALTRHAFIGVYERQFAKAAPMLECAAGVAHRGDRTLSTRYWVRAVQAQALAGLGELGACQRALDMADQVHELTGEIHNDGWLRFDGSRLAEERGSCYVMLSRFNLAETALTDALSKNLSARRRGGVLSDLAALSAQRRDLDRLVAYTEAALQLAQQTASGVIGRRLQAIQPYLSPLLTDNRVRQLNTQITALARTSAT